MNQRTTLAAWGILAAAGLAMATIEPPAQPQQPTSAPKPAAQPTRNLGDTAAGEIAAQAEAAINPATPALDKAQAEAPDGTTMPVVATSTVPVTIVIKDLKIGDGPVVPPNAIVKAHYHGTLADGRVFDSTRGKDAIEFPLSNVIEGWQLGIPGMKVGGIRQLTIPFQLAYGRRGRPPSIPPLADLTFSVQVLEMRPPPEIPKAPAAATTPPATPPATTPPPAGNQPR